MIETPKQEHKRIVEGLCRADGRCQYAIDHGAEGMGHCPEVECCMPEQPEDYEAIGRAWCRNSSLEKWFPFTADELEYLKERVDLLRQTNRAAQVYRHAAEQKLRRVVDRISELENDALLFDAIRKESRERREKVENLQLELAAMTAERDALREELQQVKAYWFNDANPAEIKPYLEEMKVFFAATNGEKP
jgi:hypothetical protein